MKEKLNYVKHFLSQFCCSILLGVVSELLKINI